MWRPVSIFVICFWVAIVSGEETFEECLTLRPLRDGKLAATFSFVTLLSETSPRDPEALERDDYSQHYTLFPLALGQTLRQYSITELHLTLNAGKWNYESWGYPEEHGVGTGAELWAWMGEGASITVDQRWKGLRNALAGLFCASLGSLNEQRTTAPYLTFPPEGSLPNWTYPHLLRHASLPSEHVCTENLTPFLKLLPCKSLSGIAHLLNPHRLFDADWHGMGVHVLWRDDHAVEVRLSFQAVFDPVRYSLEAKREWSFESLFDRSLEKSCPVASSSRVRIQLPAEQTYTLAPDPTSTIGDISFYDTSNLEKVLNVSMKWPYEQNFAYGSDFQDVSLVPVSVQRVLKGSTQARGQLSVTIKNHRPFDIQVLYFETMPWLMQFFLHTLQVRLNAIQRNDLYSNLTYIPSVPHSRPATLQLVLTIPSESTLHLTVDATKSFLRYTEHQPDAQRGWDLPPAILVPVHMSSDHRNTSVIDALLGRKSKIYTPILLIDLATPDFSMPYNVIILSCTLMTLIFGMVFNSLTRRFVVVDLKQKADTEIINLPDTHGHDILGSNER